jgi:hypothetical protein
VKDVLDSQKGFRFRNKEGVKRLGAYDPSTKLFVVLSEPENGVSKVVTAFKTDDEYVARQRARGW